jgi:hypothetical protein
MKEEGRRERQSRRRTKSKPAHRVDGRGSLSEFVRGTDDNNMAEFPLALLTDVAPPNQKTLEFQDTIKDWKTGQEITRRVCITASEEFGLPTAKDDQVLAALLQLTAIANNFSSPDVPFTKHQVIELLGWDNSGWAYERVEESLHRWKTISVHYWNAWRDHGAKTWTDTEAIGIIDYFKISDGRRNQGKDNQTQSRFVWNSQLFKSFQSRYMKPLDFGLYRSLKRPAAQRAFRFLDKRFHHKDDWEFDLRTFACEKLGFSRNYDTGQLKARLQPAMTELEEAGFIKPVSYRKLRPKTWSVLVSKLNVEKREVETNEVSLELPLVEKLVAKGVAKSTAEILVADFPPGQVEEKIQYLDWLVSRKNRRAPANIAGFLVSAIRNDYALPKECSKTNRTNRKSEPPCSIPPTTEPSQGTEISDYLEKLTPAELEQLESAALQAADSIMAEGYCRGRQIGGPSFKAYRRMMLERYIRQQWSLQPDVNRSRPADLL